MYDREWVKDVFLAYDVNCFEYEFILFLKIKKFSKVAEEWLDFMEQCRYGEKKPIYWSSRSYIKECYLQGKILWWYERSKL